MLLKYFISLAYACCLLKGEPEYRAFHLDGNAQGTTYHITYFSPDSLVGSAEINRIFSSLDSSLSLYKPYSLINKFNQSQKGILVDVHLKNVVSKSLEVYTDTRVSSISPLSLWCRHGALAPLNQQNRPIP